MDDTVYISLFEGKRGDGAPENALEFIEWLRGLIAPIPPEHQGNVTIEVGDDGDYEYPVPNLSIGYVRQLTAEEIAAREARKAENLAWAEARERAEYYRLKIKYEGA